VQHGWTFLIIPRKNFQEIELHGLEFCFRLCVSLAITVFFDGVLLGMVLCDRKSIRRASHSSFKGFVRYDFLDKGPYYVCVIIWVLGWPFW
jgi:hypothetical protein